MKENVLLEVFCAIWQFQDKDISICPAVPFPPPCPLQHRVSADVCPLLLQSTCPVAPGQGAACFRLAKRYKSPSLCLALSVSLSLSLSVPSSCLVHCLFMFLSSASFFLCQFLSQSLSLCLSLSL